MKCTFPLIVQYKIVDALAFLDIIYERNRFGQENQKILNEYTKLLTTFLKIMFLDYAVSNGSALIATILLNILSSEYVYVLPVYLPGLPIDSADGFELNSIWQLISCVYAATAYTYFDALHALLVLHVHLMTNILRNKVRIISEMAAEVRPSQKEIFERIKNVIFLHNELRS